MSTQNFPNNAAKAAGAFSIFFLFSIIIHVIMALTFIAFSPLYKKLSAALMPKEPESIAVDVVELPPDAISEQRPLKPLKTPARYAERANIVEKETFPEGKQTGRYRPGMIAMQPPSRPGATPAPSTPAPSTPAAKEPGQADATGGKQNLPSVSTGKASTGEETVGKGAKTAAKENGAKPSGAASKPNLFLPEETISALEKKYEAESPKGEQGKTLNLNTSELRYSSYLVNMKRRIELYWEYPEVAARNGWKGRLFIDFTIKKDGSLGEIILTRSSGYPVLDDAAMTALKLAAPYPAFPENFGIEQINIKGQFEYEFISPQPR